MKHLKRVLACIALVTLFVHPPIAEAAPGKWPWQWFRKDTPVPTPPPACDAGCKREIISVGAGSKQVSCKSDGCSGTCIPTANPFDINTTGCRCGQLAPEDIACSTRPQCVGDCWLGGKRGSCGIQFDGDDIIPFPGRCVCKVSASPGSTQR